MVGCLRACSDGSWQGYDGDGGVGRDGGVDAGYARAS